jgi:hypothetical protein
MDEAVVDIATVRITLPCFLVFDWEVVNVSIQYKATMVTVLIVM